MIFALSEIAKPNPTGRENITTMQKSDMKTTNTMTTLTFDIGLFGLNYQLRVSVCEYLQRSEAWCALSGLTSRVANSEDKPVISLLLTRYAGPKTYACSPSFNDEVKALAGYFSEWLIKAANVKMSDIKGPFLALCIPKNQIDTVFTQLSRLVSGTQSIELTPTLNVITNPLLLQIKRSASITYSDRPVFGTNVTMSENLPDNAFCEVPTGTILGWTDHNKLDHFKGKQTQEISDQFLSAKTSAIEVLKPIQLLWVHTDASDIKEQGVLLFSDINKP